MDTIKEKKFALSLDSIVFTLLTLLVFVLPLVFYSGPFVDFLYPKTITLFVVGITGLFLYIFKVFRDGKYSIPTNLLFVAGLFVPVWYFISSLFASNKTLSLVGTGIETGTASFTALFFILFFLVALFVRSKDRIFLMYFAFALSYTVLAVFHVARLFLGVDFLSFGIFTSMFSNTVGKWNELAILSGIAVLLSLLSIEFLKLAKGFKIYSYVVLVLGMFLLAVTNFYLIAERTFFVPFFSLVGVFSLVFFVYFLSSSYDLGKKKKTTDDEEVPVSLGKRRIPVASLSVLIISVIFTFAGRDIGEFVQKTFNLSSYEDRPTLTWTEQVSWEAVKTNPVFGYGPQNFIEGWRAHRPVDVLSDPLRWNSDFYSGASFISSTLVTTGPLGFIGWLTFMVLFIILGVRSLFMKIKDKFSHYLTVSSFLISLYLWIVLLFYYPTTVILALTFIFSGLFIGSLIREGVIKEKEFVFEHSKEKTFISIMILVVLMIGCIFWAYVIGQKFAGSITANQANARFVNATSDKDLEQAYALYIKAIGFSNNDSYYRAMNEIALAQASRALNNKNLSDEARQKDSGTFYTRALALAQTAIQINPREFQNQITLGSTYELGSGYYKEAKNAYEEASKLSINNPELLLIFARLEFKNNNTAQAEEYIGKSLELKPNYADAFLQFANMNVVNKKISEAREKLVIGSIITGDPRIFYALGTLELKENNIKEAVNALENAVSRAPFNLSMKYALAVAYNKNNQKDLAIVQLEEIKKQNSTEPTIDELLNTLKSGGNLPEISQTNNDASNASSTSDTVEADSSSSNTSREE